MRRSIILPYISNVSCCHSCYWFICCCISDAKSKAVNQSKDRLITEAKDEAIANHWNDDENEDDSTSVTLCDMKSYWRVVINSRNRNIREIWRRSGVEVKVRERGLPLLFLLTILKLLLSILLIPLLFLMSQVSSSIMLLKLNHYPHGKQLLNHQ